MELLTLYSYSFDQIQRNRLEGRVLNDLSLRSMTDNKYRDLYSKVASSHEKGVNRTIQQIKAIEEIQSSFQGSHKPIPIKGFTAAALCNDPQKYRFSKDIDLFFDDLDILKKTLYNLNYHPIEKTPAPHEDSFFQRDELIIELHNYYPILMEPQAKKETLTQKKQTNLPDIIIEKLTYSSLLEHATQVHISSNSLILTDIEMSIFLLSAHTYKDLFWQPYKIPRVRSVELLEICDLMSLPKFRLEKLLSLAYQMKAIHILRYVFSIIENAFGITIPEKLKHKETPIIKLMNDTYSPYKIAENNYFSILPFLSFAETVDSVGCSNCLLGITYYSQNLKATYYASTDNTLINYSFSAFIENDKICYQINLNRLIQNGDNICIMIDNGIFSHIWIDEIPDTLRVYGINDYDISEKRKEHSITLRFDKPEILPTHAVIAVGNSKQNKKTVTVNPVCFSQPI